MTFMTGTEVQMTLTSWSTALFSRCWNGLEPPPVVKENKKDRFQVVTLNFQTPKHREKKIVPILYPGSPDSSRTAHYCYSLTTALARGLYSAPTTYIPPEALAQSCVSSVTSCSHSCKLYLTESTGANQLTCDQNFPHYQRTFITNYMCDYLVCLLHSVTPLTLYPSRSTAGSGHLQSLAFSRHSICFLID